MAESTPHDDRRAFQREDVALPARVLIGEDRVDARSVNLSEGGILLAGTDFPSATQVRIEIELATASLKNSTASSSRCSASTYSSGR